MEIGSNKNITYDKLVLAVGFIYIYIYIFLLSLVFGFSFLLAILFYNFIAWPFSCSRLKSQDYGSTIHNQKLLYQTVLLLCTLRDCSELL